MSLETFSKYYFTTLEKCLKLTVGELRMVQLRTKQNFDFGSLEMWDSNSGREWCTEQVLMDGGSSSFLFSFFVVVAVSFCPSTLHPLFHHLAFSAFCLSPSFCLFLLLLFIHPPLHLPLHSRSHFISLSCDPSAYSKSRTNKQAAGGSSLLSIIQASQTTASMFAKHMKSISLYCREKEREKRNMFYHHGLDTLHRDYPSIQRKD